jgi:hypothetical protein
MYREDEEFSFPRMLALLGIIVILAGAIVLGVEKIDSNTISQRLTNDETLAVQASTRLYSARSVWTSNHQLYADHWSAGFDDQLTQAEKNLHQTTGEIYQNLQLARQALEKNDRNLAKQYTQVVEDKITEATNVSNTILGPPNGGKGYYEQLADQQSRADGQISAVKTCIDTTQQQLAGFASSSNYVRGVTDLQEAQRNLDSAIAVNTTRIERSLFDKPQAYLYAVQALEKCQSALADATPPTPTPEPTPIPVVQNNYSNSSDADSSDSDSSSGDWVGDSSGSDSSDDSWDSGSDSGSWDSDSWDSGSDSGSWDSDSWDSGSDSGSWDSGGWDSGSDSGSWDSGGWDSGSDSGSWDSDW